MCDCSLSYPARKAHAPYFHLWLVWLHYAFPRYLMNGSIFERKILNKKCVLISSATFVCNISHSKKNSTWHYHKRTVHRSSPTVPVILLRLYWNLVFLGRFSKNPQVPNFMQIIFLGSELFHAEARTDRQTYTKKVIVSFHNFTKVPKNRPKSSPIVYCFSLLSPFKYIQVVRQNRHPPLSFTHFSIKRTSFYDLK